MLANIVGDDALGVEIGEVVALCFEPRGEQRLPQCQQCRSRSLYLPTSRSAASGIIVRSRRLHLPPSIPADR